jgi:hypothetical protein
MEFYDGSGEAGIFDIKQSGFLSFNLIVGSNRNVINAAKYSAP